MTTPTAIFFPNGTNTMLPTLASVTVSVR